MKLVAMIQSSYILSQYFNVFLEWMWGGDGGHRERVKRERERERERERDRDRDRQTDRQTDRDKKEEREMEGESDK